MDHEYDKHRKHSRAAATTHNDMAEPGQSSRSAQLHRPEQPIASGLVQRRANAAGALMRTIGKEALPAALPASMQRKASGSPAQASRAGTTEPSTDASGVFAGATSGPGQPVPFRDEMERAFGKDFSGVKAHLGQREAMSRIGAQAATHGDSIAFAMSNPDQKLVAHELAHVVQRYNGRLGLSAPAASRGVSNPSDPLEREAEATAAQVAAGRRAPSASARASATAGAPERRSAPSSGGVIHRYTQQELDGFEERYASLVARRNALASSLEGIDDLGADGNEEAKAQLDDLLHDIDVLYDEIAHEYDEENPGDGNGSKTRGKLYNLRYAIEDDVLSPKSTSREDIEAAGLQIHLGKLAADQSPDEHLDDSLSMKDSPKAKAAREAREMQGGIGWISGADDGGVNQFRQWLQSEDDDIPDPEQGALRAMNCWEGVFYAAFKAGVTTKAALQAVYVNADGISAAVNQAIGDRRTLRELKAADQAPEVGDVIIFSEVSNHVAISLGGDRVMSLWNQPGPHAVMAQTSMSELLPHTGGESLDSILVAKNCTLFQDPD